MRPAWFPCTNTTPHGAHQHTEGPDNYYYRCQGIQADEGAGSVMTRITDEAVGAAIVAAGNTLLHGDRGAQMRAALEAAVPHLTDDGAALPVRRDGEGPLAAAPSSPHPAARITEFLRQWYLMRDRGDCIYGVHADVNADPADLLASDIRSVLSGEGATPAIDREAVLRAIGEELTAEGVVGYALDQKLADAVMALIGGAS